MTLSALPLGYCTNVHPGRSVAEVEAGLDRFAVPVRDRVGRPLAVGLWLARPVVDELLADPDGPRRLADGLARRGLTCYTLNAFPYGDFHAARVKENVYRPDWTTTDRLDYTLRCVTALVALLPEGTDGSISTLPLGFKGFDHPADFADRCIDRLIALAIALDWLRLGTGRLVRLAIEPEPFCRLETTAETVEFFERLWRAADDRTAGTAARTHLGVCYDICHQAVEFENVGESIRTLDRAGVRINKVQISCALELTRPADHPDGREALRRYVEPRYLHQTFSRHPDGRLTKAVDLTDGLFADPGFADAEAWRVHFHVPVDADRLGPLGTTRPAVRQALAAITALDYAPHLEVETYTWEVLPGAAGPDIVDGLAKELTATDRLLAVAGSTG